MWVSSFPNTICWRSCLFCGICFWLLCQRLDGCKCVVHLWVFHWIPLVCFWVSTMLCLNYGSVVQFEIGYCDTSSILFLLRTFWLFCIFYASLWILVLIFYPIEKWHWYFCGDCIESVGSFQCIAIFIILILPIHEHGRSFNLLMCSSISFFDYL
jgi:hypothetical protein